MFDSAYIFIIPGTYSRHIGLREVGNNKYPLPPSVQLLHRPVAYVNLELFCNLLVLSGPLQSDLINPTIFEILCSLYIKYQRPKAKFTKLFQIVVLKKQL